MESAFENKNERSHQRGKGVCEPPVQGEALQLLEEVVVAEGDGVGGDVLLHAVLPRLVGVPLGLVEGGGLAGGDGGCGPVRLARRPVEGHHPVVGVLLVLRGEQHAVPLSHSVEEKLPSFQIYKG